MVRYGQNHHQVGDNTGSIFPRPRLFDIRISDRPHLRDIFERQKKISIITVQIVMLILALIMLDVKTLNFSLFKKKLKIKF